MMMIPSQWARAVNDNDDGDDGDVISSWLRKIIRTTMALMLCMLHACLLFFHTSFPKNVFAYVQRRSRSTLLYKNCLSTTFLRKKRLQSQVFFPGFFCQALSSLARLAKLCLPFCQTFAKLLLPSLPGFVFPGFFCQAFQACQASFAKLLLPSFCQASFAKLLLPSFTCKGLVSKCA